HVHVEGLPEFAGWRQPVSGGDLSPGERTTHGSGDLLRQRALLGGIDSDQHVRIVLEQLSRRATDSRRARRQESPITSTCTWSRWRSTGSPSGGSASPLGWRYSRQPSSDRRNVQM